MESKVKMVVSMAAEALREHDHMTAIKVLKQGISDGAVHEMIWGMLGSSYAEVKMNDRAIECFEQTLQLNPNNHLAQFQLSMLDFVEGRYEEAIKGWERVAVEPEDFVSNFWIAKAYIAQERIEQAKPYLHNAKMKVPSAHPLCSEVQDTYDAFWGGA